MGQSKMSKEFGSIGIGMKGKTILVCGSIERPHVVTILDKLGKDNVLVVTPSEAKERGFIISDLPITPIDPLNLIETRRDFTPVLDGRAKRRERRKQKKGKKR